MRVLCGGVFCLVGFGGLFLGLFLWFGWFCLGCDVFHGGWVWCFWVGVCYGCLVAFFGAGCFLAGWFCLLVGLVGFVGLLFVFSIVVFC